MQLQGLEPILFLRITEQSLTKLQIFNSNQTDILSVGRVYRGRIHYMY